MIYDYDELKERLKKSLPKKRYEHTLGCASAAKELALLTGEDPEKAYLAGLLHDCAKGMSHEDQLSYARRNGYEPDEITMLALQILHAPVSAIMAENEYGITDGEILDAIRYHTTGRPGMSLLERIIFTADLIEPNRDFDGVDGLRKLVRENFTEGVIKAFDSSIGFVLEKGELVHPDSVLARNYIIREKLGK